MLRGCVIVDILMSSILRSKYNAELNWRLAHLNEFWLQKVTAGKGIRLRKLTSTLTLIVNVR